MLFLCAVSDISKCLFHQRRTKMKGRKACILPRAWLSLMVWLSCRQNSRPTMQRCKCAPYYIIVKLYFSSPQRLWIVCCLHLKIQKSSAHVLMGIHYHSWTASIELGLLFFHAGFASWVLSVHQFNWTSSTECFKWLSAKLLYLV